MPTQQSIPWAAGSGDTPVALNSSTWTEVPLTAVEKMGRGGLVIDHLSVLVSSVSGAASLSWVITHGSDKHQVTPQRTGADALAWETAVDGVSLVGVTAVNARRIDHPDLGLANGSQGLSLYMKSDAGTCEVIAWVGGSRAR